MNMASVKCVHSILIQSLIYCYDRQLYLLESATSCQTFCIVFLKKQLFQRERRPYYQQGPIYALELGFIFLLKRG